MQLPFRERGCKNIVMKKMEKIYPASYFLAEANNSNNTPQNLFKVMRCQVNLSNNERISNAELHWKPISKIY